jgi:hypothetical protein
MLDKTHTARVYSTGSGVIPDNVSRVVRRARAALGIRG